MGAVVTGVPSEFNAAGTVTARMNLIHQCQSLDLETVQRAAFSRFGPDLPSTNPIPPQPWATVALDPANNDANKSRFYQQVHANVVLEIIKNTLTPAA